MSLALRLRRSLKTVLSEPQQTRLRNVLTLGFRWPQHLVYRLLFGRSLRSLAVAYGSDKWGDHWYAQHYETHFRALRRRRLSILEIGIGGDTGPESGGGSLRMWRTYFPKSRIYGIDIHDKRPHDERRIKTFIGSQVDEAFLEQVLSAMGTPDIIIDDGSHRNEHIVQSLLFLFPRLAPNGIYAIEDVQTSYWAEMGGSSEDLDRRDTAMGFLKSLTDGLNHAEFDRDGYVPTEFDKHIVAMHFYHSLVFIQKGVNDEGSSSWRWRKR
jgi:demethylmacrocin O-methyltransferase